MLCYNSDGIDDGDNNPGGRDTACYYVDEIALLDDDAAQPLCVHGRQSVT